MTDDRGNNGNNREIVVWVGLESIILWLLSLVLETVLPPIPCHLMSRSPSRLKFFAMRALKLRQRNSCTRRMKEWPRIKTRIGGMRKREYNQRKYLPEKILLEIWPSWWRGREGRITGKIPRYTYLTLTPPYNLIG